MSMAPDNPQVAALIADRDHRDKPTLRAAVEKLIALAGESAHLRDVLNRRLALAGHKNDWPTAYVLGHLPEPSPAALEILLNALDHGEADIRWAIALLLGRIVRKNNDAGLFDALLIAYLGIVQIALAYALVSAGLRHVTALEGMLLLLLEPALNPVWAWVVHGENPGPWSLIGGAIVLAATVFNAVRPTRD